jgi:amylosucrase
MDWEAAARRHDPATLEGRVFDRLRELGEVRRSLPALRGGAEPTVLDAGSDRVFVWRRRHPRSGSFVGLANFSSMPAVVDADTVTGFGTYELALGSDGPLEVRDGGLVVPGLGFAWYAEP